MLPGALAHPLTAEGEYHASAALPAQLVRNKSGAARKVGMSQDTPEYCDFDCPFTDFPPAETAGLCRTISAVWCKKLKELVNKNTPCEWRCRRLLQRSKRAKRASPKQ